MSEVVPHEAEFLFYSGPDGKLQVEVFYHDESVWLTQARLAELFGVNRTVVTKHLQNIFDADELEEKSVSAKFAHTAADGKTYQTRFYNLDAIISVGYRVNSRQATRFRQWATITLHEYMIKGFALDDERLKNGTHFGTDYFRELVERIREIRLSERRLHLQLTDIFALASDYDKSGEITQEFFAFIQNKLHYAITGSTAAEIIHQRADKTKLLMGLASFKQSPDGKILRSDVTVAKNYLKQEELSGLRSAVTAFLDIAESRAKRRITTTMAQWITIMDSYLDLNEFPKLVGAGKVSKKQADEKALQEYEIFRVHQDRAYVGDFERATKKALKRGKQS